MPWGKVKNVLHISLSLDMGGLERLVVEFLNRTNKEKYNPMLCCLKHIGELGSQIDDSEVKMWCLNKKDGFEYSLITKLKAIMLRENISLVHTHNRTAHLYGCIAARMAGVRAIIDTEHGRSFPVSRRHAWTDGLLFTRLTDRVVAVSDELRNNLMKYIRLPEDKLITIINGVDTDLYTQQHNVITKKIALGLEPSDKVVGCVAGLKKVKNHRILLNAFKMVNGLEPDAKLVMVGDGPMRGELEKFRDEIGLARDVLLLGARNDIPELLSVFSVFALSSMSEGISIAILEAMSCAKPVVATDVGGNSQVVEDGVTGFLVPAGSTQLLAERIMYLLKNRNIAEKMGSKGRERVKSQFDLSTMIRRYESLYDSCLEKGEIARLHGGIVR